MVSKILFRLARQAPASLVGIGFELFAPIIPVPRLMEKRGVMFFKHPAPIAETHWLGVPKQAIRSVHALKADDKEHRKRLIGILTGFSDLAERNNIRNYTILVNAGAFQDVSQLHFHLFSPPHKFSGKPLHEVVAPKIEIPPLQMDAMIDQFFVARDWAIQHSPAQFSLSLQSRKPLVWQIYG